MDDIDLTLDRNFTTEKIPNRHSLNNRRNENFKIIVNKFFNDCSASKDLADIIEPWREELKDYGRGDYFGFRQKDLYSQNSEDDHHCWCCGKDLCLWDFFNLCEGCTENTTEDDLGRILR